MVERERMQIRQAERGRIVSIHSDAGRALVKSREFAHRNLPRRLNKQNAAPCGGVA